MPPILTFYFKITITKLFYSVLNASTGSFLLAILEGTNPAITVRSILIITRTIAPIAGNLEIVDIPTMPFIIIFIGIFKSSVIPIPKSPATSPTIKVSALNTLDISFFDAPIALKIPISFILSRTDIYVIIPIMIEDTIKDIATKAINT